MKTDLFISERLLTRENKVKDFTCLTQTIFILGIGIQISCKDTEHMSLPQEKFIKENWRKDAKKGMEDASIPTANHMKDFGIKTAKLD
jgi:hypothetical protein